jgi:FixJ family two-component response regulator
MQGVTWPNRRAHGMEWPNREHRPAEVNGAVNVHVVEDDPAVCHALKLLLEQLGHRVAAHQDAESFFEAGPPAAGDVVMVDLGLPGIGGAEVIRWLNRLDSPPHVVAITGKSQAAVDRILDGLPVPALLRKPLTEAKIAAAL